MKPAIITHRGLEPSKGNFYSESSFEAFKNHLERGYGIEFDVNFTSDNKIVILHDKSLERVTEGRDRRLISQISSGELKEIRPNNGRLCFLPELMLLIKSGAVSVCAMHLKGGFQDKKHLDILLAELEGRKDLTGKFIIFDIKPETAVYIKNTIPELLLAPSVAHAWDIKRYSHVVSGTLLSVQEALQYKQLFEWVWLDEWDRRSGDAADKTLYNEKTFHLLKKVGYKITLVTPELHATSPGLLGGEAHPDAATKKKLLTRITEILKLKPDALCTDYPEEVVRISENEPRC